MQKLIRWHWLSATTFNLTFGCEVMAAATHCSPGQLICTAIYVCRSLIGKVSVRGNSSRSNFFLLVFGIFPNLLLAVSCTIKLNYYNFKVDLCARSIWPARIWQVWEEQKSQVHKFRNNKINVKYFPPKWLCLMRFTFGASETGRV